MGDSSSCHPNTPFLGSGAIPPSGRSKSEKVTILYRVVWILFGLATGCFWLLDFCQPTSIAAMVADTTAEVVDAWADAAMDSPTDRVIFQSYAARSHLELSCWAGAGLGMVY